MIQAIQIPAISQSLSYLYCVMLLQVRMFARFDGLSAFQPRTLSTCHEFIGTRHMVNQSTTIYLREALLSGLTEQAANELSIVF